MHSCAVGCSVGYCDASVGKCVCAPGWAGPRCDHPYLAACRVDARATLLACQGFTGVMSCACRDECVRAFGVSAVYRKPCFTASGTNYSGLPSNLSTVRFWAESDFIPGFSPVRRWSQDSPQQLLSYLWAGPIEPPFRGARRIWPSSTVPLQLSQCPRRCSGRGTCFADVTCAPVKRLRLRAGRQRILRNRTRSCFSVQPRCGCHDGFDGDSCQRVVQSTCLHSCNNHGKCFGRFCLCMEGWWGLDCSLSTTKAAEHLHLRGRPLNGKDHNMRSEAASGQPTVVPIFVYPLPAEVERGMHFAYQGGSSGEGWRQRGIFASDKVFVQRLHKRGHLVSTPEEAALFLVPVQLSSIKYNLWEPQEYLRHVVHSLSIDFPFWNRSGGVDHVFLSTQDLGGCWISPVINRSIIVSHFGFVESMPIWMSSKRWTLAIRGLIRGDGRVPLCHGQTGEACHGPLHEQYTQGCTDTWQSLSAAHWRGPERFQGACFDEHKDIVIPTDFKISRGERRTTRRVAQDLAGLANRGSLWWTSLNAKETCEVSMRMWNGPFEKSRPHELPTHPRIGIGKYSTDTSPLPFIEWATPIGTSPHFQRAETTSSKARDTLLFMSGSVTNTAPWYSQRVRQEFYRLHRDTPGVKFVVGHWNLSAMRSSTFCLCPSGWGYGWRTYIALATLCIPVIVQPMIKQAFHDLLPYHKFSLTYTLSDIPRLPEILRAIPPQRVCELRINVAFYYRALQWQEPDGMAYEMLLLSLCQRAIALHHRLHHDRRLPTWANCASVNVKQLLQKGAQHFDD